MSGDEQEMKNSSSTHPDGSFACKTATYGGEDSVTTPGVSTVGTQENPTIADPLLDAASADPAASADVSSAMDREIKTVTKSTRRGDNWTQARRLERPFGSTPRRPAADLTSRCIPSCPVSLSFSRTELECRWVC
jgi:hypothetical protein